MPGVQFNSCGCRLVVDFSGFCTSEQKSTWKVLPRSIQMHIMKESEEEGFWERLLKVTPFVWQSQFSPRVLMSTRAMMGKISPHFDTSVTGRPTEGALPISIYEVCNFAICTSSSRNLEPCPLYHVYTSVVPIFATSDTHASSLELCDIRVVTTCCVPSHEHRT